jgi:hypothetical protein
MTLKQGLLERPKQRTSEAIWGPAEAAGSGRWNKSLLERPELRLSREAGWGPTVEAANMAGVAEAAREAKA